MLPVHSSPWTEVWNINWVLALLSNYCYIKVHKHSAHDVDLMNFVPDVGKKCFWRKKGKVNDSICYFPSLSFTQQWPWKRRLYFESAVLCLPIALCRIWVWNALGNMLQLKWSCLVDRHNQNCLTWFSFMVGLSDTVLLKQYLFTCFKAALHG